MKTNELGSAVSHIGRALLIAWMIWLSAAVVDMKSEITLLKYAVFKTVAKDETIPGVEQEAGAGLIPLPHIERKKK